MNETFSPGDVVSIIGIGVPMTVDEEYFLSSGKSHNPRRYTCVWFNADNTLQRSHFSAAILRKFLK